MIAMADHTSPANWRHLARCAGKQHLFFAPYNERPDRRIAREAIAKRICARCPAAEPCRTEGRTSRAFGIWGGESEIDRIHLGCGPPSPGGSLGRIKTATDETIPN